MDTFLKNSDVREAVPAEGYIPYTKEQIFAFLSPFLLLPSLPPLLLPSLCPYLPHSLLPFLSLKLPVSKIPSPQFCLSSLTSHLLNSQHFLMFSLFYLRLNSYQYSHYAPVSRSPRPQRIVPGYWLWGNSSNLGGPLHNSREVVHLERPVYTV